MGDIRYQDIYMSFFHTHGGKLTYIQKRDIEPTSSAHLKIGFGKIFVERRDG